MIQNITSNNLNPIQVSMTKNTSSVNAEKDTNKDLFGPATIVDLSAVAQEAIDSKLGPSEEVAETVDSQLTEWINDSLDEYLNLGDEGHVDDEKVDK